ncbi:MAG: zinc-ribbon domain-containing protein [Acidaminococcaceae bacterium]|nr:zinc-ribbon domain-containing protein [Acidaminococcaceae bacterium]MBQ9284130.1 zinc-ribbon domain-containing protein [Acidaminococcaceae bacterium]MBQ9320154.1 zinc-ribbon domain-containing protein [Acidaminococcaceae bacterium]MBR1511985.1 zinc-ribbon domain-containing protein [Acidaminococcaceae bacterium]
MRPDSRFCENCGAKNAPEFCMNCGAKLEPGAAFCGECGSRV